MAVLSATSMPRFSKYSGVVEWKNAVVSGQVHTVKYMCWASTLQQTLRIRGALLICACSGFAAHC